jgi:hypothetical protein
LDRGSDFSICAHHEGERQLAALREVYQFARFFAEDDLSIGYHEKRCAPRELEQGILTIRGRADGSEGPDGIPHSSRSRPQLKKAVDGPKYNNISEGVGSMLSLLASSSPLGNKDFFPLQMVQHPRLLEACEA